MNGFTAFNSSGVPDFTGGLGHGSHIAGTIAGTKAGVSKLATIVAVKVVDKETNNAGSDFLAGVNWAVNDIQTNKRQSKAVINISLESKFSQTMNDIVNKAAKDNILFAVAAGNSRCLFRSLQARERPLR